MFNKVLFFIVFALPLVFSSRPTHCERWRGSLQFRCGKDGYQADRIHIRNTVDGSISFKVGKWVSECGRPGVNYSDQSYSLGGGGSVDVDFMEVSVDRCNELFVYECELLNYNVNCLDIVSVYPL